jgi:uncharacterized membrane protein YtjA (UPF0391 family)
MLLKHGRAVKDSADLHENGRTDMLHYALVFLVVGLIAGILGMAGIAAIAGQIAWVLFLIGVVMLVIHVVAGPSWRTR